MSAKPLFPCLHCRLFFDVFLCCFCIHVFMLLPKPCHLRLTYQLGLSHNICYVDFLFRNPVFRTKKALLLNFPKRLHFFCGQNSSFSISSDRRGICLHMKSKWKRHRNGYTHVCRQGNRWQHVLVDIFLHITGLYSLILDTIRFSHNQGWNHRKFWTTRVLKK